MGKLKVFAAVLLLGAGYGLLRLSKARNFQFFGGLVSRVETGEKLVALTFDDAPTPETPAVLKLLAQHGVKATFYCIGSAIARDPAGARQIAAAGHELGNHTYSHRRMVFKTPGYVAREVEETSSLIRGAAYAGEITFRPPYGKKLLALPWYLHKKGIRTILWDVEPDTYFPGDAARIADYTLANVRPGSIILLHALCGAACAADRAALPAIIEGLKGRGYTFVTISRLK